MVAVVDLIVMVAVVDLIARAGVAGSAGATTATVQTAEVAMMAIKRAPLMRRRAGGAQRLLRTNAPRARSPVRVVCLHGPTRLPRFPLYPVVVDERRCVHISSPGSLSYARGSCLILLAERSSGAGSSWRGSDSQRGFDRDGGRGDRDGGRGDRDGGRGDRDGGRGDRDGGRGDRDGERGGFSRGSERDGRRDERGPNRRGGDDDHREPESPADAATSWRRTTPVEDPRPPAPH